MFLQQGSTCSRCPTLSTGLACLENSRTTAVSIASAVSTWLSGICVRRLRMVLVIVVVPFKASFGSIGEGLGWVALYCGFVTTICAFVP